MRATALVKVRNDDTRTAKPGALALNGRRVHLVWPQQSENKMYPGETEWTVDFAREPDWPADAPVWFASGDLSDLTATG